MNPTHENSKTGESSRRFLVTVERQTVEAFKRVVSRNSDNETATGLNVPLTFPAAWYGLGEVRDWIMETVGFRDKTAEAALLHLEQTIEMTGKLEIDETYTLEVRLEKLRNGETLKLSALVSNRQELPLARMTSLFAVVSAQGQQQ